MSLPKQRLFVSVEEYLAGERESPARHEYVAGQVYAMAGASDRHNRIAGNIFAALNGRLDDSECEPFISDMKIMVAPDLYYYPDVVVTCHPPGGDRYTRSRPVLVVEVLSPTTERTDRGEKLAAYRDCETVREYVLASQDRMLVELHRRQGEGWTIERFTETDEHVTLASVDLTLTLGEIYRNVRFDDEGAEQGRTE